MINILVAARDSISELQLCIDRVERFSDCDYRLIIVDDLSRELGFKEYLKQLESSGKALVLRNRNRLGFIGSLNRGLQHISDDVIIFNHHTLIQPDFIEKLTSIVYAGDKIYEVDERIAVVTICPIPDSPSDVKLQTFADLNLQDGIEAAWQIMRHYPFVTYIRREALGEVSGFTADPFEYSIIYQLWDVSLTAFRAILVRPLLFFLLLIVMLLLGLIWNWLYAVLIVVFLLSVIYEIDARLVGVATILQLLTGILFLIQEQEIRAESAMQNVYFLLVITTVLQVIEHIRFGREIRKQQREHVNYLRMVRE